VSDLAVSLTALADSLEPATVTDRTHAVAAVIEPTEILAMPLDRFAREGQCLEVRVPWLDVTLWFVPAERDAAAIARTGGSRGRVWTANELAALMALPDRTPATVEAIARAKLAVDGDIAEVRPRESELR
jgi:ubiquinone biosynthesis protein UbiJ